MPQFTQLFLQKSSSVLYPAVVEGHYMHPRLESNEDPLHLIWADIVPPKKLETFQLLPGQQK